MISVPPATMPPATALERNRVAAQAPATRRAYDSVWRRFESSSVARAESSLPADPMWVATYLSDIGEVYAPATVRLHAAAIGRRHRDASLPSPLTSRLVRDALAGAARRHRAGEQRQAAGLTAAVLDRIRASAANPRRTRGGRIETPAEAARRGAIDVALASIMRDALLRRSEAAALRWRDLEAHIDGSGRLSVRRSKTDPTGAGAIQYISAQTMRDIGAIRPTDDRPWSRIFELSAGHIARRLAAAGRAAGIDAPLTGHSPRVGMAQDLAADGTDLPALLQAGRWQSPRMPARYIRAQSAGRSAVAQFYGGVR